MNETSTFSGNMDVEGDIKATGIKASGSVSAGGISSSTITSPRVQKATSYLLSGVSCHWQRKEFDKACGTVSKGVAPATASWGGQANFKSAKATGSKLTIQFTRPYSGSPFCFVSFGGADTTNSYSINAYTDRVEIHLKKKGCCSMNWADFDEKVSLVCHGAGSTQ